MMERRVFSKSSLPAGRGFDGARGREAEPINDSRYQIAVPREEPWFPGRRTRRRREAGFRQGPRRGRVDFTDAADPRRRPAVVSEAP